jgi:hypothetical protein
MVSMPKTEKPRAILADGLGALMKPLSNGIKMKTITSNNDTQSNDGLSAQQRELLANFSNMSQTARDTFFAMSREFARILPRNRPQLKLVAGGAA